MIAECHYEGGCPNHHSSLHGSGCTALLVTVRGICLSNEIQKLVSEPFLRSFVTITSCRTKKKQYFPSQQFLHIYSAYKPRFDLLIIKLSPELPYISYRRWYIQMKYAGQWYICSHCMRQEGIYKHWRVRGVPVKWNCDMQGYVGVTHAQVCQNHVVVYKVR